MRSKSYQKIKSKLDKTKLYTLEEAMDFLRDNSLAKFDQTIELHIALGIDSRKTEQQVRGTVILPHGGIKKQKIAVFVNSAKLKETEKAGADLFGGQDLIDQIKKSKKCNFDIAIAEPDIMKDLSQIAKILGPKGLMPSPKSETITTDIKKTIDQLKKGKVIFKNDAGGNLHLLLGKISWKNEQIKANFEVFLEAVKKVKPSKLKGIFLKKIILTSTMGPGIKIQI